MLRHDKRGSISGPGVSKCAACVCARVGEETVSRSVEEALDSLSPEGTSIRLFLLSVLCEDWSLIALPTTAAPNHMSD